MKKASKIILIASVAVMIAVVVVGVVAYAAHRPSADAPHTAAHGQASVAAINNSAGLQSVAVPGDPAATQQVPILVYHSIAPKPDHPESQVQLHYRIDPQNFAAQMQFLKTNGYTPITFNALAQYYLHGTPIPQKAVVLTFDDGWHTQVQYAVPVLEQYGFTATFFVITDYMKSPYMSWDDARNLDVHGFEIGSHTEHHLMLTTVTDPASLHDEIFGSKQMIESELGHPITTFAYPDYATNVPIQLQMQAAGYLAARAGWSRLPNSSNTIYALKSQEAVNNPDPFSRVVLPSE
jgi:peptidoglycan/xylan/chitin deacetylase (PgdA/CDA1 family)